MNNNIPVVKNSSPVVKNSSPVVKNSSPVVKNSSNSIKSIIYCIFSIYMIYKCYMINGQWIFLCLTSCCGSTIFYFIYFIIQYGFKALKPF
jgi:hypothetical protein